MINVGRLTDINKRPKLTTRQLSNDGRTNKAPYEDRHMKTIHTVDSSVLARHNGPCVQNSMLPTEMVP